MASIEIFTIGHSSHPLGTFLWMLRKHEITALVDIRRYPASKRHPHFSRELLSVSLAAEDIEYHWLKALGGDRKRSKGAPPSLNRGIEDVSLRNYADHMATDKFRRGGGNPSGNCWCPSDGLDVRRGQLAAVPSEVAQRPSRRQTVSPSTTSCPAARSSRTG